MAVTKVAAGSGLNSMRDFLVDHRVRITVSIGLVASAIGLTLGRIPLDPTQFRDPLAMSGLGLIGLGLALRSWAAGILRKGTALTTTGPYHVCRHPLYLGSLLMLAGCLILFPGIVVGLPTLVLIVGLLLCTIGREEERIAARFGREWYVYIVKTPGRLTPSNLFGLQADWSLAQWLRNREYQLALATLLGLAAAKLWLLTLGHS